jgi:hypothetical protein
MSDLPDHCELGLTGRWRLREVRVLVGGRVRGSWMNLICLEVEERQERSRYPRPPRMKGAPVDASDIHTIWRRAGFSDTTALDPARRVMM